MVLFCIATVGMFYCIYVYIKRSAPVYMIILRCLDIITIVVPPALPAARPAGVPAVKLGTAGCAVAGGRGV